MYLALQENSNDEESPQTLMQIMDNLVSKEQILSDTVITTPTIEEETDYESLQIQVFI